MYTAALWGAVGSGYPWKHCHWDIITMFTPPPPVSNEHCVQRTLPVRTVFFVYLINSVHN